MAAVCSSLPFLVQRMEAGWDISFADGGAAGGWPWGSKHHPRPCCHLPVQQVLEEPQEDPEGRHGASCHDVWLVW